ncbi:MAG: class I SAM-dependent methyltransferase [Acidimicrobiales bacterium]
MVEATGLGPAAQLLEVGCATGKATLPLARRGFVITCLEPGPALAAAARTNLSGFEVRVIQERFERWPPDRPYDLVLAATAWHWVDPKVRYHKAAAALRPQGWLAFCTSSLTTGTPSSGSSNQCTKRSARACLQEPRPPGQESCPN